MIPIQPQPEPSDFNQKVRVPGQAFLDVTPHPKGKNAWKNKEFWTKAIPDLKTTYGAICTYSSLRIFPDEIATVDHFIPKSQTPALAYEWSNFRLAKHRINSKKGDSTVLDPFKIENDWFVLDFVTFMVHPNKNLSEDQKGKIRETILRLGLNHQDYVEMRTLWYDEYKDNILRLEYFSPFIAYEMRRQEIVP